MQKTILIFIPDTFQGTKTGYLEGFYREYQDCEAYYIINNTSLRETPQNIGLVVSDLKVKSREYKGLVFDNVLHRWEIAQSPNRNFIKVFYEYEAFRESVSIEANEHYGEHFQFLAKHLKKSDHISKENGKMNYFLVAATALLHVIAFCLKCLDRGKCIWGYSATFSHFYDNIVLFQWTINELIREKHFSLRVGNLVVSKLADLALGIYLLTVFLENEAVVLEFINSSRESIIHNFRHLLIYLMGSPIGLKLNYAFNSSLGKFFFYHISLWRIFLLTMQPYIGQYFKLLVLPGAFGFSYQIAMISDVVSIATFHVYCIYVYAARLLYLQLKGLWSLWRLFIGRKHNPLRERVDSFHYSQHQLFIGTLGFTVLLFLLPTTIMYYTVFVIFRLIIMIVEETLIKIRFLLHCVPIYVIILWIFHSPKLKGPIFLKVKKSKDGTSTFEAKVQMLPINTMIKDYAPNGIKWSMGLSWRKITTGVLL